MKAWIKQFTHEHDDDEISEMPYASGHLHILENGSYIVTVGGEDYHMYHCDIRTQDNGRDLLINGFVPQRGFSDNWTQLNFIVRFTEPQENEKDPDEDEDDYVE